MRLRLRLLAVILVLLPAGSRSEDSAERAKRALRQDSSLKVRTQAALVLGQRGRADAVPALSEALAFDEAAVVRMAAASALGKIGDAAAREALEKASRTDRDGQVRAAAARALADLGGRQARGRVLAIEDTQGTAGDSAAREVLREALERKLAQRGFSVVKAGEDATYRIKPSMLSLEVAETGDKILIDVRASAVAVDDSGRMAAMIEGSARLKAQGGSRAARAQLSARAINAAADTLSDDLAARLR